MENNTFPDQEKWWEIRKIRKKPLSQEQQISSVSISNIFGHIRKTLKKEISQHPVELLHWSIGLKSSPTSQSLSNTQPMKKMSPISHWATAIMLRPIKR